MRNDANRDVLKVWLYAATSVFAGAIATPWIYSGCMALAEVTANRQTIGAMERLGAVFASWGYPSFFSLSLIILAVVLFIPFAAVLRLGNRPRPFQNIPWKLRLPEMTIISGFGQPLRKKPMGPFHWITGVILMAGVLLLIGYALSKTGSFVWIENPPEVRKTLWRLLFYAVTVPLLLEILFRGISMGIFLRAMSPKHAIIVTAIFSALLHFYFRPTGNLTVPDPEALSAGMTFLGRQTALLVNPFVLITEFLPILAAGFLFSYARWRTSALWLPAGLHTGWSLANGLFLHFALPVPQKDIIARLLAGDMLQHGILSLIGVVTTITLLHFLTLTHAKAADPTA